MIYAYDKLSPLPIRDIYDTQMMLAAIGAAKDMYEKGVLQIKDFKKEYGDFYSPILSDMDWYKENVTDPITNTINDLYARGIDPVRSVEGRAAVSKIINSVNTGEIAQKKRQAEAAESYIKSRDALLKAGLWNPEYERQMLGGLLLEEWDGSLGNWTATSASPYQDYHQKYNHLFKDMDYEYDEEESKKHPGMIAMTRSKSRMHDILSSVRKDLENDPQYQYDLNNLASAIKQLNPDILPEDALSTARRMLEDEIVERNYKGGMKLEIDPIWKDQQDFKQQVALENLRHSHNKKLLSKGKDEPADKEYGSYGLALFQRGLYNFSKSVDPGLNGLQIAKNIANETHGLPQAQRMSVFLDNYSMNDAETSGSWILRFAKNDPSRLKDAAIGGVRYVPSADRSKLYTLQELTSNTLFSPDMAYKSNEPIKIKDSDNNPVSMTPTGRIYTAPMKNNSYELFVEVLLGNKNELKKYYYKIYQSEPVPNISTELDWTKPQWSGYQYKNDGIVPPGGFNVLPSENTIGPWSLQDRSLNSAVGYGSEPLHSGSTIMLNEILNNQ